MMKSFHRIGLLLLLFVQKVAATEMPHWYFDLKRGSFKSAEEQWSEFYGDDRFPIYAFGLGYKVVQQIEIGVEGDYLMDQGEGWAPGHGTLAGTVDYRLYPVHLQLTLRAIFHQDQWLVPYVGAGVSHLIYRIKTESQSDISGSADGRQYRAGLQILLDNLDKSRGIAMQDYGVENTYFFIEAQRIESTLEAANLGGTAYLGGLRFEF
jgi:opacity protein-like surface antigen